MRKSGGVRAWFSPYLSYMLLRIRTRPEVLIRIVAPKVAGSSPVGHPFICRQNVRAGSYTGPLLLQPYCNPIPERFVQPFYSIAAYALQEVRVAVHRLRDGGVP